MGIPYSINGGRPAVNICEALLGNIRQPLLWLVGGVLVGIGFVSVFSGGGLLLLAGLAGAAVRGRGHDGLALTALCSWPHELRGRHRRRLLPVLYRRYVCHRDGRRLDGARFCGHRGPPRPPAVSRWVQRAQLLASGASTSAGRGSRPWTTLKPV